jgi:hypothetical protein
VKIWKKGPRRWLRFSLLVAPVKKMREVFFIHPVMEKKFSQFLKIHFHLPRIDLGRWHDEQAKMGEKLEKRFFWDGWYSVPPPEGGKRF